MGKVKEINAKTIGELKNIKIDCLSRIIWMS